MEYVPTKVSTSDAALAAAPPPPPPPCARALPVLGVELLVLVVLELAEDGAAVELLVVLGLAGDGATAAEDPEVVIEGELTSGILGCKGSRGFRCTGTDGEVAWINMVRTSDKKATKAIICWIAMFITASAEFELSCRRRGS